MTKEEVIALAREAGMADMVGSWCQECGCNDEMLIRFAELVVDKERADFEKRLYLVGYLDYGGSEYTGYFSYPKDMKECDVEADEPLYAIRSKGNQ